MASFVITGCFRGPGPALAWELASPPLWVKALSGRVEPVMLDFTDQTSIENAVVMAEGNLGGKRSDVLINNAVCLPIRRRRSKVHPTIFGSIALAPAVHFLPAPSYKISKAALHALTVWYSLDHADEGFAFIALCPSWLKTILGGGNMADLTQEEGAKASLDILFKPNSETNGKMPKVLVKAGRPTATATMHPTFLGNLAKLLLLGGHGICVEIN
ncbi:short chain dehydrogenase reductase [Xylariaceae sp. FL1651]|nr:short chain dehydrogenase reductase [Xylariaceae sp. FL1651]